MPLVDLRYLTSHSANDIINTYVSVNIVDSMAKYFAAIPSVLTATAARVRELGLATNRSIV